MLTEAWTRAKLQHRVVGVDVGRQSTTKLGGEIDAGVLWASGSRGLTRGGATEVHEGQGGPGIARGGQMARD